MCLCLCCVFCEALLSNICVWIWKPNEDKLSVIQYLWECQVEIVIDGGWNYVMTLTLVEFYENVVAEPRKPKKE